MIKFGSIFRRRNWIPRFEINWTENLLDRLSASCGMKATPRVAWHVRGMQLTAPLATHYSHAKHTSLSPLITRCTRGLTTICFYFFKAFLLYALTACELFYFVIALTLIWHIIGSLIFSIVSSPHKIILILSLTFQHPNAVRFDC